ncbi:hypothetical protein ABEB36_010625 [Hypothenemus hampei]|uniref:THAP-type domain-containing protein n=1 Tax=Hypothenemus hampei TaxID=57062 RepID=A0ABD1ECL6_HYPHA
MRCVVFGCNSDNQSKKNPISGVKFFHFPKDKDLAIKWLYATGRKDKVNLKYACVCSKHFSDSDFKDNLQHRLLNYSPLRYRGLKDDAIPNKNLPLLHTVNSCSEFGVSSSTCNKKIKKMERTQLMKKSLDVIQANVEKRLPLSCCFYIKSLAQKDQN